MFGEIIKLILGILTLGEYFELAELNKKMSIKKSAYEEDKHSLNVVIDRLKTSAKYIVKLETKFKKNVSKLLKSRHGRFLSKSLVVYNLQNSRPPSGSVMGENIQAGVSLFGGAAGGLTLTVGSIGLVTMFGAASTGTAISALSGAAATNALLAWFGGGALVMGGAGMAGGAAILVGIAVVPGVAIATYLTYRQSKKVEQRIELYEAATIEVHANYNRAISLFELVQSVIVKLEDMSSNFDELCFLEKNWMNSDIKFFSFKFTFQLRKKVRIETIEKAGIFLTKFNKEISQLCLSS